MKTILEGTLLIILAFVGIVVFFNIAGLFVNVMSKLPVWVGVTLFVAEIIFILKKVR
jgi:hypothetical protein